MSFAEALAEKRGPRVGDAASLWNFAPAPGWSREEVQILRLCIMKHGVGQWMQILNTGLLPGKLIQQLNGQTQRLLGQQSLAAYTGLKVDVDRIRSDNESRTDATRKAGLIIYDGPNLTKEMRADLREEATRKYGLTPEQLTEVDEQLAEVAAALGGPSTSATGAAAAGVTADAAAAIVGPCAASTGPVAAAGTAGASGGMAGASAAADAGGGMGKGGSAAGGSAKAGVAHTISRNALAISTGMLAATLLDPFLGSVLGLPAESLSPEQLLQLLQRLRNRLACLVDRHHSRASQPAQPPSLREGPRWAGEPFAAAVLAAMAAAEASAPQPPVPRNKTEGSVVALGAGGGPMRVAVPFSRELLAEATACRVRSGTAAAPAPRGAAAGVQTGGVKKRGGKPGKPKAAAAEREWSPEGEENAVGPSGAGARTGAKRKSAGSGAAAGADAEADAGRAKRTSRAKRPSARYDHFIDDEFDEEGLYGGEEDDAVNPYGRGGSRRPAAADPADAVSALTAMGFTPRKARGALRECDFNVERAVEWLFANCV